MPVHESMATIGDERVWVRVLEWFCNFEERNGMLTISDEVLESARISANELQQEIAVYLYSKNKLSFGQARKIAGLNVFSFRTCFARMIFLSIIVLKNWKKTIKPFNVH